MSSISHLQSQLRSALIASAQTSSAFDQLKDNSDWDGDGVRDPLNEASRDTVEINSSQYGDQASSALGGLESLNSQLSRLASSGSSSHSETSSALSEALYTARSLSLPPEVESSIQDAISAVGSANYDVSNTDNSLSSADSETSQLSSSIYSVSRDEDYDPEWFDGEDVSLDADSGLRSLDRITNELSKAGYAAGDVIGNHRTVQSEVESALGYTEGLSDAEVPDVSLRPAATLPTSNSPVSVASKPPFFKPSSGNSAISSVGPNTGNSAWTHPQNPWRPFTSQSNSAANMMRAQQMQQIAMMQRYQQIALFQQAQMASYGFF